MSIIRDYVSIFLLSAFTLIIFHTGCVSSVIKESVTEKAKNNKIGGELLIHNNPKAGDYAVYKVTTITKKESEKVSDVSTIISTVRYEVKSVKNDELIVVRSTVIDNTEFINNGRKWENYVEKEEIAAAGVPEEYFYLYPDGQIKKVIYVNKNLGINMEYKLAEPGKEGFIKYGIPVKAADIQTGIGVFKTDLITCEQPILVLNKFEEDFLKGYTLKKGNTIVSTYINPEVNFKKLKSHTISKSINHVDTMFRHSYSGTWSAKVYDVKHRIEITEDLVAQGTK